MKKIIVLGSTGSIGCSTLDIIRMHPERFDLIGLQAGSNRDLLISQALEFDVDLLALSSAPASFNPQGRRVIAGDDAAVRLVRETDADIVVNGIAGAAGFPPSFEAVSQGATLALANKESMVIGGAFITAEAERSNAQIIPVDSEHSAIFQCLTGENPHEVRRILLTASGGPFRDRPKETFRDITPDEALSHPTWSMGKRITIDSATMMNKGLEIIEACWLFGVGVDMIHVLVHPQSIVHSMVEFHDMSIKAQLGIPDMRVAIAYALSCPERMPLALSSLDIDRLLTLDFMPPDEEKFPALRVARSAMDNPSTMPCIMNAADEVAIQAFLEGRIRFDRIIDLVVQTMDTLSGSRAETPQELMELDGESREITENLLT
ncbi:MAG TPA: 1-deoxy-D-xylulose-5-phosphate reductoisomerase [Deltaproteobacteria bacterium]|mgnify:CR=1 FL=1|nr:1-deoxy-D-xylulose-5-phosphate reductoisomerase [Deltaproteobacteria bacterium]